MGTLKFTPSNPQPLPNAFKEEDMPCSTALSCLYEELSADRELDERDLQALKDARLPSLKLLSHFNEGDGEKTFYMDDRLQQEHDKNFALLLALDLQSGTVKFTSCALAFLEERKAEISNPPEFKIPELYKGLNNVPRPYYSLEKPKRDCENTCPANGDNSLRDSTGGAFLAMMLYLGQGDVSLMAIGLDVAMRAGFIP